MFIDWPRHCLHERLGDLNLCWPVTGTDLWYSVIIQVRGGGAQRFKQKKCFSFNIFKCCERKSVADGLSSGVGSPDLMGLTVWNISVTHKLVTAGVSLS